MSAFGPTPEVNSAKADIDAAMSVAGCIGGYGIASVAILATINLFIDIGIILGRRSTFQTPQEAETVTAAWIFVQAVDGRDADIWHCVSHLLYGRGRLGIGLPAIFHRLCCPGRSRPNSRARYVTR